MKKMLVLSALLLVAAFSCDRGDDSGNDLLTGEWTLADSPYPYFTPTVTFTAEGRYIQNSITTLEPFQTLSYVEYSIKGDYVFSDSRIIFNTATVSLSEDSDDTLYPYGYVTQPGCSLGLWWSGASEGRTGEVVHSSGYTPVEWRVLELSEHTLRVSLSPGSETVYTR